MAAKIDTGMPKGAMRKLLNFSKQEPVGCAVGIGDSKAVGLMVLHKIKRGTAMKKMLEEGFPEAKSVRFGTVSVDAEDNPTLVRLQLNRAAPGIAKKLILTLKGTGFKKVVIVSDDGVTEEHEEEDNEPLAAEEDGEATPAEAEAPVAAAPPPPPPAGADGVPPAPPPPAGEAPEVLAAQKAALTKALAALMAGIPKAAGDSAERKALLMKLATDANVNLKTGNLKYAGSFVAQLKKEIEAGAAGGAPGGDTAAKEPGKLEKLRIDWRGVQQDVAADVDRLAAALASTYAGTAIADEVVTRFRTKVGPMLARFDDRLGAALDQVTAAQDAEARAASTTAAKAVVKDYLGFAMTDALITDLDANPFVPLTIRSKATKVLGAVAQAIA